MCDPFTMMAASFAISTVSTVAEYQGAKAQAKETNRVAEENAKAAQANLNREYRDTQVRIDQEQEAAAVQKQDLSREARAARATTMAAAGESGVSGLSVDALLADIYGKEATAKDRIDQNSGFTTQNLTNEMDGFRAKAIDRINSAPLAKAPSLLAAGLKIGASGLNSYGKYKKWTE